MQLELTDELKQHVADEIKSGRFQTEQEVVLDMLERCRQFFVTDIEDLRREIQVGIDEIDRGEFVSAEEVFAQLRKRNRQLREKV
ncbi:hypothetical protein Pan216_13570 [Planctomycetes bacterium Pan216]|uniref:Antitoxin ParD4 n=1 Tax=Kolteria novifilia TaxID=2527975 RepID=A0A518B0L7_9BACT|nr:hypothetical protein Pan216_13570 [Planctomycetes bacterium Pan216]